jgi:hypothetical protein
MAKKPRIPHKFHPWIDARKKFRLSHAHIQMARELGLNPKKFAGYASNKDQPWKRPLPEFIESLYEKRFGKRSPDVIRTIEEIAQAHVAKRAARKAANASSESSTTQDESVSPEVEDATKPREDPIAPDEVVS